MMERHRLLVFAFLIFLGVRLANSSISASVPEVLQACYRRNFTVRSRPPLTMSLLIELLRKIELNEFYTINTRILSASMLYGIVFDGIQKTPGLQVDDNLAIPYAATLNKFHKFKVIVDYLISGRISQFPLEALTLSELCFLHRLTSNTVDRFERGDETSTCEDNSLMPSERASLNRNAPLSMCPLKLGNLKTKWGPVSASHLIAGIAAGLQQNQVTFQRVFDAIHMHEGTTNVSYKLLNVNDESSNSDVDSVLFATIAGDLGEVVLTQATENPIIGNKGYWNDTLLPRAFYLRLHQWDLTEAEILGGLDAAILGKNADFIINILDSTRLSQLLDMYYSDRGIPYQFNYKVSNRTASLKSLLEDVNLPNQIYGSTKLLQAIKGSYSLTLTDNYITELSSIHAEHYMNITVSTVNDYDKIEYVTGNHLMANLEVIVILDGTFDPYATQLLLFTLSEAIDVSYYGSRMGIINGQTGAWITNVTREHFNIFESFQQLDEQRGWPVTLSLGQSLETVTSYYQNRTQVDCNDTVVNPMGQVIVVFSRDGRLIDNDITRTTRSINTIKQTYPETAIVYVSPDTNGVFKELQTQDDFLVNPSNDVLSTATKIVEKLSVIPGSLIKFYCNHSNVRFEEYFTPGVESVFEIHREYIKRGDVTTKFLNKDYGDLSICFFTSGTSRGNRMCQSLTVNGEISFNSGSLCTPDWACDVRYSLTANNSRIKCAENDCRYPDQVLVIITYSYTSRSLGLSSSLLLVVLLVYLLTFTF